MKENSKGIKLKHTGIKIGQKKKGKTFEEHQIILFLIGVNKYKYGNN